MANLLRTLRRSSDFVEIRVFRIRNRAIIERFLLRCYEFMVANG